MNSEIEEGRLQGAASPGSPDLLLYRGVKSGCILVSIAAHFPLSAYKMHRTTRVLLIVSSLVTAGCGTRASEGVAGPPGPAGEDAAFEALFQARADSARMNFTEADVHFIQMMIPHHGQALEMSTLVPDRAADPAIRTLAARITGGQREEIARMEQWLRDRGISVPEEAQGGPVPAMDHAHSMPGMSEAMNGKSMPGMLSPEEMAELANSSGAPFDRLFLTLMIRHHQGAVEMVDNLFATPGAGKEADLFQLAADIRVDQTTEVARMERMLLSLGRSLTVP